jgi:YD repeat-containing protein
LKTPSRRCRRLWTALDEALAPLLERREKYRAQLEGDGATAQGDRATALGKQAVQARDVGGDVVTGHKRDVRVEGGQVGVIGDGTHVEGGITYNMLPPGADPAALREAYLHHLLTTAGQLSLTGIDPKAASEREAQLSLSAVYTGLLILTPEECSRVENGVCLPERMERSARRLSVVAQLDRHKKLVLLGDPGSGKTIFVNFVTLCLVGERLQASEAALPNLARLTEPLPQEGDRDQEPEPQPWRHGVLLPVRVILRDFAARGLPPVGERATAAHLWAFIAAELEKAALGEVTPHLKETLQQEGGLLLLDGLDEVPAAQERRVQIKQVVTDFVGSFGKCRVLVTSRTYAYQRQAWRLPDFAEAVLAPFGAGQIARFVDRWYQHIAHLRGLDSEDAAGRAELLQRAIDRSTRLQGLAARPLLLTLMASLHAWRGGSLPEKREELYADTVDLPLDWWEQPKVVRDRDQVIVAQPSLQEWLRVARDKVRKLLDRLAYQAHASQPDLVGQRLGRGGAVDGRLGRPVVGGVDPVRGQVTAPGGYVTKMAYQGRQTAVVDANNHQKISEVDAFGQLVTVKEYSGSYSQPDWTATPYATTDYAYDILGNLTHVEDDAGNDTWMNYNEYGQKTSMDDPDMGVWTYT